MTRRAFVLFTALVLAFTVFFPPSSPLRAQEPQPQPPAQTEASGRQQAVDSLEKRIAMERDTVRQLRDRLRTMQDEAKRIKTQLNDYRVMSSAVSSLLNQAKVSTADLENGYSGLQSAMDRIAAMSKELQDDYGKTGEQLLQAQEEFLVQQKAVQDMKATGDGDQLANRMAKDMKDLTDQLAAKRDALDKIHSATADRLAEVREAEKTVGGLQARLAARIADSKKKDLFTRNDDLLTSNWGKAATAEAGRLATSVEDLFSPEFWLVQGRDLLVSGGYLSVRLMLLLLIVVLLLYRLRKKLAALKSRPFFIDRPWMSVSLSLLHRTLPLLGATICLYGYGKTKALFATFPVSSAILHILMIWLGTKWVMRFLRLYAQMPASRITEETAARLRAMVGTVRMAAILYVIASWLLDGKGVLLMGARIVLEIGLVLWCLSFWRDRRKEHRSQPAPQSKWRRTIRFLLEAGSIVVVAGGALLELAGYGGLALLWYVCWGRTVVVSIWGAVLLLTLYEFTPPEVGDTTVPEHRRPIKWFLFHLFRLLWLACFVFSLLLAWGASHTILLGAYFFVSTRLDVGNLKFSIIGVFHALILLLITHTVAQLWRPVLLNRVLHRSGLEAGLQESIATISIYCIWIIGIVAALNAFGLSMATMAVAFGALGIGLGFGLQNIFNNFVSGIILLFERPVQVGDVVEIDGTWGRIEKINVRATVVQTFENASLIIPNSEFISNRVKNWSFRDLRVRRSINVGVAYGSDVQLVRQTLLEAAEAHPQVLKIPPMDVLFLDFGDSALMFRLRFWCTLGAFYATETDLRFEIDRLFRERDISIPFPQRDIHIVSEPNDTSDEEKQKGKGADTDGSPEENAKGSDTRS